jgi:phosphoribosylformimino-5-aminoimidazole carboxamide ribotide isomerase
MLILPVLDLMAGQVVRGIAGRRGDYRPIVSQLTSSSDPAVVAAAFARRFDLTDLYLADLDAIAGEAPAREIITRLHADGFRLRVDAGIRTAQQARELRQLGVARVVVGLETVAGPAQLAAAIDDLGERAVFSLDLRDGQPLGDAAAWPARDPEGIAEHAIALGVSEIIVLDLARVGVTTGTGTESLCATLSKKYPRIAVYAGGGVRGVADLRALRDAGIRGALVASALHDGLLSREELAALCGS